MGSSIAALGHLIGYGGLFSALTPVVTVRPARGESAGRDDATVRMLLGSAVDSSSSPLVSLAKRISELETAAVKLSLTQPGNVLAARTVTSDHEDAVTGTAQPGTERQDLTVHVRDLARGQINLSDGLAPSGTTTIVPGSNTFTVTRSGTTHTLTFDSRAGSTNLETLTGIANRINGANIGITARVIEKTTSTRLELKDTSTGAGSGFTLKDAAGNVVTALGAETMVIAATDARAEVNGTTVTSSTNTLEIQGGSITLQVSQITANPVRMAVSLNVELIVATAKSLADKLNALADQIERGGTQTAQRTRAALVKPIRDHAESLAKLGFLLDKSNRLTIDEVRLKRAIERSPEQVEKLVGGPKGFATTLVERLRDLAQAPTARASKLLAPSLNMAVFQSEDVATGLVLNVSA